MRAAACGAPGPGPTPEAGPRDRAERPPGEPTQLAIGFVPHRRRGGVAMERREDRPSLPLGSFRTGGGMMVRGEKPPSLPLGSFRDLGGVESGPFRGARGLGSGVPICPSRHWVRSAPGGGGFWVQSARDGAGRGHGLAFPSPRWVRSACRESVPSPGRSCPSPHWVRSGLLARRMPCSRPRKPAGPSWFAARGRSSNPPSSIPGARPNPRPACHSGSFDTGVRRWGEARRVGDRGRVGGRMDEGSEGGIGRGSREASGWSAPRAGRSGDGVPQQGI